MGAIFAVGMAPAIVRASSLMKIVVPRTEIIIPSTLTPELIREYYQRYVIPAANAYMKAFDEDLIKMYARIR